VGDKTFQSDYPPSQVPLTFCQNQIIRYKVINKSGFFIHLTGCQYDISPCTIIHFYCTTTILTTMDGVDKFLRDYFSPQVEEDSKGIKVVFIARNQLVTPSIIWFRTAKRGWSRKPLSQNKYIIVDADTQGVLDFVNKYYGIEEKDLPTIRTAIVNLAIDVIDNYFNPDEGNKDTQ